jgi:hypothetical protein
VCVQFLRLRALVSRAGVRICTVVVAFFAACCWLAWDSFVLFIGVGQRSLLGICGWHVFVAWLVQRCWLFVCSALRAFCFLPFSGCNTTQHNTTQRSITVRSVRSRQHRPPGSLGEQQRTGTVHITLTLHKSNTQVPVGTSKEQSSGDCWSAYRRDFALAKSSHPLSCEPSVPVTQNARMQTNPREGMFPQHLTEFFSVHVLVARHNDNPFAEPTNTVQHRIVLALVFCETTTPVECNTLKMPASYRQ